MYNLVLLLQALRGLWRWWTNGSVPVLSYNLDLFLEGKKESKILRKCIQALHKQSFEEQIEQLSSITHRPQQTLPKENYSPSVRQGQANVIKCSFKILWTRIRGGEGSRGVPKIRSGGEGRQIRENEMQWQRGCEGKRKRRRKSEEETQKNI